MNSKERVQKAIRREPIDRVPLDCWLHEARFCKKLNDDYGSVDKFMDEFNIDIASSFVPFPNQFGEKDEKFHHPHFEIEALADLKFEDPRDPKWRNETHWHPVFRGVNPTEALEKYGDDRFIATHVWGMVEGTSSFLGIENCWLNLSAEPELMGAWLNRYAHWLADLCEACIDQGADMIRISDDWGQNGVELFPPDVIRDLLMPNLKIVVERIRSKGAVAAIHSDGYIMNIMDEIVGLGVQVLHPCQESAGMDQALIKEKYGDDLIIHGGLDVMEHLLLLEGEALEKYIRRQFEICKPGGGFIYNGTHIIQPDISPAKLCQVYRLANELAPY